MKSGISKLGVDGLTRDHSFLVRRSAKEAFPGAWECYEPVGVKLNSKQLYSREFEVFYRDWDVESALGADPSKSAFATSFFTISLFYARDTSYNLQWYNLPKNVAFLQAKRRVLSSVSYKLINASCKTGMYWWIMEGDVYPTGSICPSYKNSKNDFERVPKILLIICFPDLGDSIFVCISLVRLEWQWQLNPDFQYIWCRFAIFDCIVILNETILTISECNGL